MFGGGRSVTCVRPRHRLRSRCADSLDQACAPFLRTLPASSPPARADLEGRQRKRDLHQSSLLRRVLRSRSHSRGSGFLSHRHNHAQHAGIAHPALPRPGELEVPRLRIGQARSRPVLPVGEWEERVRPWHLGALLPLPPWHVLHSQQRQRPDHPVVPRHQSRRPLDADSHEAFAARPLGPVRRRRQGVRRVGLSQYPYRPARCRSHRPCPRHRARIAPTSLWYG